MAYKYFPQTEEEIKQMLAVAGVNSLADLYGEVPEQLKLKNGYNIPSEMSEIDIRKHFKALGDKNKQLICFAGAGAYDSSSHPQHHCLPCFYWYSPLGNA